MAELANCSRCNAVFVKSFLDICQKCYREEEDAFQIVYQFLRVKKNREATVLEIVEETGVDEMLIIKFVKEKRLTPTEFPSLAYPCKRCGRNLTEVEICKMCSDELHQELARLEEAEKKMSEREESEKQRIYFAINKD